MSCCNPFTSKCEGGHGCAAHTKSLSISCCGRPDCLDISCPGRPELTTQGLPLTTRNGGATIEDGESNHPWSDLTRFESTAIWIIVGLCAWLVSYLCFLAWCQFY